VPSKTLIATSDALTQLGSADHVGVRVAEGGVHADLAEVNQRVKSLALAQSADITARLVREGVTVLRGHARLLPGRRVQVDSEVLATDVVLLATGATPRVLAGAEFASAYLALGCQVTLVSSRERVLPSEDADAADQLQQVFVRRGMRVLRGRAAGVDRTDDGVLVRLVDGSTVAASHCLMTVGSVPNTKDLGLEEAGVAVDAGGFVTVDRVSRTTADGVYAAGDVTGVLMLASVAAMQGRIAMWHALGEAVAPLRLGTVAANVFTDPEVASVGITQQQVDSGAVAATGIRLPLATNARAKMQGLTDGFVKLFCRPGSGQVLGGVVVAPHASELILAVSLAVQNGLTADQVAHTFSIYPSLSGSLTEAARQLMTREG
jgi:dihydrolipoamide dehydrogenase